MTTETFPLIRLPNLMPLLNGGLWACHPHNRVNLSNSQLIKDLNDECFNGKEKDGFGIWGAVIQGVSVL